MQIAVERSSPKTSESATRTSRARPPAPLLVQRRTTPPARPPAESTRAALEQAFGVELFAAAATGRTRAAGDRVTQEILGAPGGSAIQAKAAGPGVGTGSGPGRGVNSTGIPSPVKAKMEAAFGADFSGVRVHPSSSRAVALGALAYTQGSEIHVAPGQWAPETRQGQELLGHELAHVVQQREGRVQATAQYKGVALNDEAGLEAEADAMGARAAQGASAASPARTGTPSPAGGQVSQAFSQTNHDPGVVQRFAVPKDTDFAAQKRASLPPSLYLTEISSKDERHHIVSDRRILRFLDEIAIDFGNKKVVDANSWAHAALEAEVERTKEKMEQLEGCDLSTSEARRLRLVKETLKEYKDLRNRFRDEGTIGPEEPKLDDSELECLLTVLEWMPPNLVINRQVRRFDPGDALDIEALVLHPDLETRELLVRLAVCLGEINDQSLNLLTQAFERTSRKDDWAALLSQARYDREDERTTELLAELVTRPAGGTGRGLMKRSTSNVKEKLGNKRGQVRWETLLLDLFPYEPNRNP
ncbi:eCIS core domain-containing protein [Sorangium sp. So ce233]|uniref:eCIS core domain-containing protein n=1 Tax=Sorangium sp. So ce233 TaxID=3133290 RepID=UPI003F62C6BE